MKKRPRSTTFTSRKPTTSLPKKRKRESGFSFRPVYTNQKPITRRLPISGNVQIQLARGERIEDRGSIFVAHAAFPVSSRQQADAAVAAIRRLPELQGATHNIAAYRIAKNDTFKDDDGEKKAGGKLLAMLKKKKVLGAVVVVSRWYGGQNLGPVRFHHITSSALQVLHAHGMKPDVPMGQLEWGEGHRLAEPGRPAITGSSSLSAQGRRLAVKAATEKRVQLMMKSKPKVVQAEEKSCNEGVHTQWKATSNNVIDKIYACPVCSAKWRTLNELNGHLDKCLAKC